MIPLVKVAMPPKQELIPALEQVLYSGMIAEGESVYRFEAEFQKKFGLSNVLAMSSGTGALHAALTLAGVAPGDEVISTPMTAEPTNTSILYLGAKPIWADVDPSTGNMDPESVRSMISPRTKAIVVVHYAGYPAKLAALRELADEHGIALIEDSAHALGATYDNVQVGMVGDFSIFSFQAIKHMTTVDGGMLVMKNPQHMVDAKKFRWFGMLKGVPRTEVDITSVGYKYNMNNVTATIGEVQLKHIDVVLDRHIANGCFFDERLKTISGVAPAVVETRARPSYWLYTMLCDNATEVEAALLAAGVMASKLHRPNNLHSIFAQSNRSMPGVETFYQRLLHIPCGWWVSDDDREKIVETIRKG